MWNPRSDLATDADLVSLDSALVGVSPLPNRLKLFVDEQPDASLFGGFIVSYIFCVDGFAFQAAVCTRVGNAEVVCLEGWRERRVRLRARANPSASGSFFMISAT